MTKNLKITYPSLPMLLLEGGLGRGHLGNPSQRMKTTPTPAPAAPTMYKNHHHTCYVRRLLLLDGGRYLPTGSASADVDVGPVVVS